MAEAHSAVAFSFSITHRGVNINYNRELLAIVWRSGVRSWKKRFFRFANNVRNGFYPQTASSLWVILAILTGIQTTSQMDPSFGAIPVIAKFVGVPSRSGTFRRSVATLIYGSCVWLVCSGLRKYALKTLFSYKGWMIEARGAQVSLATRLWTIGVKLLSGSSPRLFSYQGCLPKLPVPRVQDTMARYLASVEPLVTVEEYQRLEKLAEEFKNTVAPKLQRYLYLKSWWASNYVSDWWEEFVYLRGRGPLMTYSNFYCLDPLLASVTKNQAARAANLTHAALIFRRAIDVQLLQPIMMNGLVPLCSHQYERMFNTTRIPGFETDRLQHLVDSTHICVMHRGRFYKVLTHHNAKLLSSAELQIQFERILCDPSEAEDEKYLASLTAGERRIWAETRANCFRSGLNRVSLDAIESSAFVVALDEEEYEYDPSEPEKLNRYAKSLLHGNGYNRWFDKSFNLIVGANGKGGFNAEHSWADAPVMGHLWETVMHSDRCLLKYDDEGNTMNYVVTAKKTTVAPPERLRFHITSACVNQMQLSVTKAKSLLEDLDLYLVRFQDYGKTFIKQQNLSPDAYLQMAIQLAHFRDKGKFCLTYEAAMTRLFREGRTETVRPVNRWSCDFVRCMNNRNVCNEEKRAILRVACEEHVRAYQRAMRGEGIDRHLFCLYLTSKYLELESPFLREVLAESWRLSTSQTSCNQSGYWNFDSQPEFITAGGGFGPVAKDGYGVSYMLVGGGDFFFHVSSRRCSPDTNSCIGASLLTWAH
ncbi:carnitine O-palmitoyltransferase 1, muscle isoform-like [Varroa jacobsoni]|uniref:carnitine O-palmitoyltransferase 1, muscle isoform-like n=1 Tax=Varroa jacobsoni TaxID=62625 RepID=UPI000BF4B63C|nr:carnitine O-palmitoyltransferase 1, muscle isoform-like [Varroa jacobsoni]